MKIEHWFAGIFTLCFLVGGFVVAGRMLDRLIEDNISNTSGAVANAEPAEVKTFTPERPRFAKVRLSKIDGRPIIIEP